MKSRRREPGEGPDEKAFENFSERYTPKDENAGDDLDQFDSQTQSAPEGDMGDMPRRRSLRRASTSSRSEDQGYAEDIVDSDSSAYLDGNSQPYDDDILDEDSNTASEQERARARRSTRANPFATPEEQDSPAVPEKAAPEQRRPRRAERQAKNRRGRSKRDATPPLPQLEGVTDEGDISFGGESGTFPDKDYGDLGAGGPLGPPPAYREKANEGSAVRKEYSQPDTANVNDAPPPNNVLSMNLKKREKDAERTGGRPHDASEAPDYRADGLYDRDASRPPSDDPHSLRAAVHASNGSGNPPHRDVERRGYADERSIDRHDDDRYDGGRDDNSDSYSSRDDEERRVYAEGEDKPGFASRVLPAPGRKRTAIVVASIALVMLGAFAGIYLVAYKTLFPSDEQNAPVVQGPGDPADPALGGVSPDPDPAPAPAPVPANDAAESQGAAAQSGVAGTPPDVLASAKDAGEVVVETAQDAEGDVAVRVSSTEKGDMETPWLGTADLSGGDDGVALSLDGPSKASFTSVLREDDVRSWLGLIKDGTVEGVSMQASQASDPGRAARDGKMPVLRGAYVAKAEDGSFTASGTYSDVLLDESTVRRVYEEEYLTQGAEGPESRIFAVEFGVRGEAALVPYMVGYEQPEAAADTQQQDGTADEPQGEG